MGFFGCPGPSGCGFSGFVAPGFWVLLPVMGCSLNCGFGFVIWVLVCERVLWVALSLHWIFSYGAWVLVWRLRLACGLRFALCGFAISRIFRNFVPYPLYFGGISLSVWDFAGEVGVVVTLIFRVWVLELCGCECFGFG